ncbi:MAG: aminotransferase class IV [Prolixibacteraceae bacterium]
MCQLLESLKLKDGQIQNLEFHQNRLNRSIRELFPEAEKINLGSVISIPENCKSGVFKVRVLYRGSVEKIEIEPYHFRTIESLKVVHHESIDYHLKYSDRQLLQELFARRGTCDDIIIVKNGFIGDSFAANLLFFDGENWFTPTTALLKGTKRQFLLEQGIISEREIRIENIRDYQKVGLVNALVDFEEMPVVPIEKVIF